MNDRQYDPYDPYAGSQYEIVGYDEYGQPVYRQVAPQQVQDPQQQAAPGQYDPYAAGPPPQQPGHPAPGVPPQPQGYGYDPYGALSDTGQQQPSVPPSPAQEPFRNQEPYQGYERQYGGGPGHDPSYGAQYGATAQEQPTWVPQHQRPEPPAQSAPPQPAPPQSAPPRQAEPAGRPGPQAGDGGEREYRTEQFQFIDEPDEESEDVIDWLKFTESRTERREEAKRRGRNRMIALVVVLALALVGGVGYLWSAGKLPGLSDSETGGTTASGPQKRDVIVVHLHNTKQGGTSTALLVDNTTTGQGTTVLLPNALAVTNDDGDATTLGKSVEDDGAGGTRDALDSLLGTRIEGTWRLDTPYLDTLVETVGDIEIDTNADVPDPEAKRKGEAPLVRKGESQTLSGPMAVAYATYRGPGEAEDAQLERFGEVMQGVLRKISTDQHAATITVQTLTQILDPSLTEKDLGASLAKLAAHAKDGDYKTSVLPVAQDGTLSAQAKDKVVKDVLGGKVKAPDQDAAVRVNLSGAASSAQSARVSLVNGGWTVVQGSASGAGTSRVTYGDEAHKSDATEVAKTLGLPASAVTKAKVPANADIAVVLGSDYRQG